MNRAALHVLTALGASAIGAAAAAAPAIDWFTVDSGGGSAAGGLFDLQGSIGQHDAQTSAAGQWVLVGGFVTAPALRPGCSPADLAEPFGTIDLFDILQFFNLYGAGDLAADFAAPLRSLDLFDILEFFQVYAAGC